MPAPRPLYLYKFQHAPDCKVHLQNLNASAKKFYKACDCFVWITGTTTKGEFVPRQSTGLRDWAAAEAYLASINKQVAAEIVQGDQGITLEKATQEFSDGHAGKVGKKTLAQHKLTLARFVTYAKGQGVTYAQDVTYDLCKKFLTYGFPGIEATTKSTYQAKFKTFLKEAGPARRKWIKEDFAKQIENEYGQYEETEPFSDAEIDCILKAAENLGGGTTGYATNGKTFRLLIEFMLATGLRVSDTIRYNPSMAIRSKTGLWKYVYTPKKQPKNKPKKKTAVTFLSDKLKTAIDQADWFSKTHPFAYGVISKDDSKYEQAVYERMQAIGTRCSITDCRPHRCRDTFAVTKLLKGMALDDVSKLLAHGSIRVTSEHYAKWTVGREDRLEALFLATL
jgi:integrase